MVIASRCIDVLRGVVIVMHHCQFLFAKRFGKCWGSCRVQREEGPSQSRRVRLQVVGARGGRLEVELLDFCVIFFSGYQRYALGPAWFTSIDPEQVIQVRMLKIKVTMHLNSEPISPNDLHMTV